LSRKLVSRAQQSPAFRENGGVRFAPAVSKTRQTEEFRTQARSLATPLAATEVDASSKVCDSGGENEDAELAGILAAIAEDVERWAAGARAGIAGEYAGKIADARKNLPRNRAAGAVRAFNDARISALALVKRMAAVDLATRREAAILASRNRLRARRAAHTFRHSPSNGPNLK
jgi:hypothetical protein